MRGAESPIRSSGVSLAGLMSQFYALSSRLWSRALVVVARTLGSYGVDQELRASLEPARLRRMSAASSEDSFDSVLAFSTQMQLEDLREGLEKLQQIQGEVEEMLAEPLTEPHPHPLPSLQQDVLRELIRRGLWPLEALMEAIHCIDEDLACHIENLSGGSTAPIMLDQEAQILRKSLLALRAMRLKIRVLKAEIHRLETLNPRPAVPAATCERRVQFA